MEFLKRILAVFLLALYVAYSGGIGFSVHNCEHCHQKRAYFFQHPDCCASARAEHHHQAAKCENGCHHDAVCCHHSAKKTVDGKENAIVSHCQPCCVSEFQFFKVYEDYFVPKQEQLMNITDFLLFTETASFSWEQCIVEEINFSDNNPNPPPLLPGGERFIVFTHQLLFYA